MLKAFLCSILSVGIFFINSVNAAALPKLQSSSWILVDRLTNTILTSKHADKRVNPGNSTQLMVLYVVEKTLAKGQIQRNSPVLISEEALSIPPLNAARYYLEPNKKVTVAELENAVAVMSANDAAVALALHIGGTIDNFVELMNQEARSLGMENTHYVHPIGSKNTEQYTTAKDTLVLANALLNEFPVLGEMWISKHIKNGVITHKNSNTLLWKSDSIRGLHSSEFQLKSWNTVAYYSRDFIEGNVRFSRELLGVSLGAKSSEKNVEDTMRLITWGADNYKTLLLYQVSEVVDRIPVKLANNAKLRVCVEENVYATLPRDAILQKGEKGFRIKVERIDPLVAPIKEGEFIGTLTVIFNDKEVAKTRLVAQHAVQRSNFWRRSLQKIKAIFGIQ